MSGLSNFLGNVYGDDEPDASRSNEVTEEDRLREASLDDVRDSMDALVADASGTPSEDDATLSTSSAVEETWADTLEAPEIDDTDPGHVDPGHTDPAGGQQTTVTDEQPADDSAADDWFAALELDGEPSATHPVESEAAAVQIESSDDEDWFAALQDDEPATAPTRPLGHNEVGEDSDDAGNEDWFASFEDSVTPDASIETTAGTDDADGLLAALTGDDESEPSPQQLSGAEAFDTAVSPTEVVSSEDTDDVLAALLDEAESVVEYPPPVNEPVQSAEPSGGDDVPSASTAPAAPLSFQPPVPEPTSLVSDDDFELPGIPAAPVSADAHAPIAQTPPPDAGTADREPVVEAPVAAPAAGGSLDELNELVEAAEAQAAPQAVEVAALVRWDRSADDIIPTGAEIPKPPEAAKRRREAAPKERRSRKAKRNAEQTELIAAGMGAPTPAHPTAQELVEAPNQALENPPVPATEEAVPVLPDRIASERGPMPAEPEVPFDALQPTDSSIPDQGETATAEEDKPQRRGFRLGRRRTDDDLNAIGAPPLDESKPAPKRRLLKRRQDDSEPEDLAALLGDVELTEQMPLTPPSAPQLVAPDVPPPLHDDVFAALDEAAATIETLQPPVDEEPAPVTTAVDEDPEAVFAALDDVAADPAAAIGGEPETQVSTAGLTAPEPPALDSNEPPTLSPDAAPAPRRRFGRKSS